MSFFRRFRDVAICGALLAIPFFFLNSNLKDPARTSAVDRFILQISAPIQFLAARSAEGVSSVLEEYVFLIEVQRDNERLRRENARLRQETHVSRREGAENRRLRELLALRERFRTETISAEVIGKEVSPAFRVIRVRIDRGELDHVRPGMPVVSSQGLVGQVRRTWGRYGDVLLTVDSTSSIDVVVQRSGARGILVGTGEDGRYLCRIQWLQRGDEVVVGDSVHTSGLGQRFPASILAGRVTAVLSQDFGLYQEIEVAPAVNFSTLDEVLILTAGSKGQSVLDDSTPEPDGG